MNRTAKALRLYTHTHTHTHTQVFLVKYGAKEEVESTRRVVILPRDCEWFQSVNSTTIWEKYGVVIYMH